MHARFRNLGACANEQSDSQLPPMLRDTSVYIFSQDNNALFYKSATLLSNRYWYIYILSDIEKIGDR